MKKIASVCLIFIFALLPISPSVTFLLQKTYADNGDACSGAYSNVWYCRGDYVVISGESDPDDPNTVWSGNVSYPDKPVILVRGAILTIEPGTHVEINKLIVADYSQVIAEGTKENNIVFTKPAPVALTEEQQGYDPGCFIKTEGTVEFDSWASYQGDPISSLKYVEFEGMGTNVAFDADNCPGSGNAVGFNTSSLFINTAHAQQLKTKTNPGLRYISGQVIIENATFKNNFYADVEVNVAKDFNEWDETQNYDFLRVENTNFENNQQDTAVKSHFDYPDAGSASRIQLNNNWYGSTDGPKRDDASIGGDWVTGPATITGHSPTRIENSVSLGGVSNVLFLPGIEASNLYKEGSNDWDDLWPPTLGSNDMQQLLLNSDGQSRENVFTNDIIESAGGNIYKTFADKLRSLKNDSTINDFNLFAYDWRQSVEDIAKNGTPYAGSVMKSATTQAKALALTSKSKKVTLVAHSNGGLLAKAIMLELKKEGKEDMVDKIIFVGSPQMGTPRAITSMLYGYDEGLVSGLLATDAKMRTLAENMPGAYGLLPSEEYLKLIKDPMIKFDSDNTRYKAFKDAYGEDITKDEYNQFFNFLLGKDDGREKPATADTNTENVLNENLLQQAKETHEKLAAWSPLASQKVYEIAGWGLDTIKGVEYKEKKKTKCNLLLSALVPFCYISDENEAYFDPMWTVDGDKIVVAPSALMLENADNVKRYWVDLYKYNDVNQYREHKNILEIDSVRNFISNILANNAEAPLPEYIKTSRPADYESAKPRLRMSLYSPLDIHLYANGKHTGPVTIEENGQKFTTFEEQIPNSYYYQFGDRKYVGIPTGEDVQIKMDGYDSGSYTLKIEEVKETENGEEKIANTTFANLPVLPNTKVTLDIPESGLGNLPNLKADYNGDGNNDYEVAAFLGGEAQIVDNVKPTIEIKSPEVREYLNNKTINVAYNITDNLSPESEVNVKKYIDGQSVNENQIDLSMLGLGNHVLKITATDKANNIQEKAISFSVTTSLQAIKDNVQKYYAANLIKNKQQKDILVGSLENIEQSVAFLQMIKMCPFLDQKIKNIVTIIVKNQIKEEVDFMLKQISKNGSKYDPKIKPLLIKDLQWLEKNAVKW